MTATTAHDQQAAARAMWALGDYHRFAKELVWGIGPRLVDACGIGPGQRVLDVAAGTGNVAIRAAEAGADVVACDLTPEHFPAGRREASARGVELEWVQADAQALPFGAASFDVVTSSFGVIFAPDHQAAADEMLRVCRPGGTIALANFAPTGIAAEFFSLVGRHAPAPPPEAGSPLAWGEEGHVRDLFGDRVSELRARREQYVERAATPGDYWRFFRETFGPIVAISAALDDRGRAALEREFLEMATRCNRGAPDGPAEYPYDYLLVVARRR